MGKMVARGSALALVVGLLAMAGTAPADARYSDVVEGSYYEDGVAWLLENGLATGTSNGCFEPDRVLTRAEAATFLHKLAGTPAPAGPTPFTDTSGTWAADAVAWMAGEGITTGVGGGRFAPEDVVTRGQFATFLYRYENPRVAVPQSLSDSIAAWHGFSDVIAGWQQDAVNWLVAQNITVGTSPGQFSPDQPVTLGQLATFLYRYKGMPPTAPNNSITVCHRPFAVHAVGDVNFAPGYGPNPQLPYSDAWSGMGRLFLDDDLTIINLECTPSLKGTMVPKTYNFRCPLEALAASHEAGIEVANLANNHGGDFGIPALMDGVANVTAAGITPVGAGFDLAVATRPAIFERDGVTVAVLGFNAVNNSAAGRATETKAGMAYGDIDIMVAAVQAANERADYVFVTIHWGIEKTFSPAADDIPRAHALIDAGADAVFGHGPHRIQPLEFYNGRPIFWSLGNFVWHNLTRQTAVAEVLVAPDGTISASLIPGTIVAKGHPVLD